MTPFTPSPLRDVIRSPMQLAALYKSCLGEKWNSYPEAARYLSAKLNTKVDAKSIRVAVVASTLPPAILGLFRCTGLKMWNARDLASAQAAVGLGKLLENAAALDATEMTAAQLVRALRGEKPRGPRKVVSKTAPLTLAETYRQGLDEGAWSTTREAAEILRVNKRYISDALDISNLPNRLKECFTPDTLSRRIGLQLVRLAKVRTPEALCQAVQEALGVVPRLSEKAFIARLAGIHVEGVELKVRKTRGRFVIELHCDADETKLDANLHWLNLMAARAVAQIR